MKRQDPDNGLLDYLSNSPGAARATDNAVRLLGEAGYEQWGERDPWQPEAGSAFYVRRGAGGVIAVRVGSQPVCETGFRIVAAHTDSPALKVKPRGIRRKAGGVYVPVEIYGGPIQSTWLDRELVLTGRAVVREASESLSTRTFTTSQPCAVIPNLAIHLNREINKGFEYNAQDHLQARLSLPGESPQAGPAGADGGRDRTDGDRNAPGQSDRDDSREKNDGGPPDPSDLLWNEIATALACRASDIVSADVFLADPRGAQLLADGKTVVSGRIDNLAGCYSSLRGFLQSDNTRDTLVAVLFDNEEIGSRTAGGADSAFLESVLQRIAGGQPADFARAAARSLLVSNDGAHALHDSYSSKYDNDYAPVTGGGPVIKTNASYRYASSGEAVAITREIAHELDIPLQYLAGRSDMRTGSTIGPFAWSRTGAVTVDLGIPMLAMHSIRETAQTDDVEALTRLITGLLGIREDRIP
ncbi:MAG: M18 family aminopeptidase [Spirochaetia bacterium]